MKALKANSIHIQRAQSLVELAISLTVLLLLLSGAVTFGMALFSYVSLRDAAQEGALYASFNPCIRDGNGACHPTSALNRANIVARIRASSTSPVDLSSTSAVPDTAIGTTLTTGQPCEGSDAGGNPNAITVSITYRYRIFMPFVGAILGTQEIPLTGTVTDTILEPRCTP